MKPPEPTSPKPESKRPPRRGLPELYQVVIECAGEEEQRELFERLAREGLKLRLLVL